MAGRGVSFPHPCYPCHPWWFFTMATPLEITIYDEGKLAYPGNLDPVLEFGRPNIDEEAPYKQHPREGMTRGVIARLDAVTITRPLLRVDRVGDNRATVTNTTPVPL